MAAAGLAGLSGCQRPSRSALPAEVNDELSDASAILPSSPAHRFLRDAGQALKGTKVRIITEDTPPSLASLQLARKEFEPLTGIQIEWITEPLDNVFARLLVDTAQNSGYHDLFYLDQSWRARFADALEPVENLQAIEGLQYPDWDFEDFLLPLREHLAAYQGHYVAVPYDITIFIAVYRRDILEQLGLQPPRDFDQWRSVCAEVQRALAPATHGMTAQWRVGHYALQCNMTTWLWGHGGSILNADGSPAIDNAYALEGLDYMMSLADFMPSAVTTWDWHDEALSFARGDAALYASWSENFPRFDDPARSQVAGLCEAIPMPRPRRLRPASECAYGETPGAAHQGGSSLGLSAHSKNKEAAWVFLQWLTSPDIVARSCLLGGGASAVRASTFTDPRILKRTNLVGPGTTRHFDVMHDAIMHHMGSEPHHPKWPELSRDHFAVQLGKMVTRQQSIADTTREMAEATRQLIRPHG